MTNEATTDLPEAGQIYEAGQKHNLTQKQSWLGLLEPPLFSTHFSVLQQQEIDPSPVTHHTNTC
jgi:hypothetical protein